jgi:hypothetical protein
MFNKALEASGLKIKVIILSYTLLFITKLIFTPTLNVRVKILKKMYEHYIEEDEGG